MNFKKIFNMENMVYMTIAIVVIVMILFAIDYYCFKIDFYEKALGRELYWYEYFTRVR